MERKLSKLFDFQRFSGNKRLGLVIATVESRYAGALSENDLKMVSAAGESEKLASPWAGDPMTISVDDMFWKGH